MTPPSITRGASPDGLHRTPGARRLTARQRLTAQRRLLGVVVVAVVLIDQASKTWAENQPSWAMAPQHVLGPVSYVLTLNPGASFGVAPGDLKVITTIVAVMIGGLFVFGARALRNATVSVTVGVALFAGGALSNVTGRLLRGHHGAVIDFIEAVRIGHHDYWPVFNLADAAIVIGSAVLLLVCFAPPAPPRHEATGRTVVH